MSIIIIIVVIVAVVFLVGALIKNRDEWLVYYFVLNWTNLYFH